MIHGHTHRPGHHEYLLSGQHASRWVLPAWDDAPGYLRVDGGSAGLVSFD
jgi:UDP-2,3-diacylglucosamine hydrolase